MSDDSREGLGALAGRQELSEAKRLGCSAQGCAVPPEMASFIGPDGRAWCISHNPDPLPKRKATAKGGDAVVRRRLRAMPPGTPNPDWSSPKAIRAWLEDRAGRIERGELDKRAVPADLAKLAKETHDAEALEKLDGLEALIRSRLTGER